MLIRHVFYFYKYCIASTKKKQKILIFFNQRGRKLCLNGLIGIRISFTLSKRLMHESETFFDTQNFYLATIFSNETEWNNWMKSSGCRETFGNGNLKGFHFFTHCPEKVGEESGNVITVYKKYDRSLDYPSSYPQSMSICCLSTVAPWNGSTNLLLYSKVIQLFEHHKYILVLLYEFSIFSLFNNIKMKEPRISQLQCTIILYVL